MGSPKTPIRPSLDNSFDDDDSDEMESPSFPHLIPVYNRRNTIEYDLDDVRIGWDDGCGSVCYQDYGYGNVNNIFSLVFVFKTYIVCILKVSKFLKIVSIVCKK